MFRFLCRSFIKSMTEYEVLIDIHTLEVVRGSMPRRALALVLEWAFQHLNP